MNKRAALAAALAFFGGAVLLARRANAAPAPSITEGDAFSALRALGEELNADVRVFLGGGWSLPSSGEPYREAIEAAEDAHGIPRNLLARLLWQESRFRPDIIDGSTRSPVGAVGIAQFMPATALDEGVDPLDPFASIDAAGRYLAKLQRQTGDWKLALAAYNWGVGNVKRRGIEAAPKETRDYVAGIAGDVGLA